MPNYFGQADLPFLMEQMGQDVTVEGTTIKAIVNYVDRLALEGEAADLVGLQVEVIAPSSVLRYIAREGSIIPDQEVVVRVGSTIEIDGKLFVARGFAQEGDGAVTKVYCQEML